MSARLMLIAAIAFASANIAVGTPQRALAAAATTPPPPSPVRARPQSPQAVTRAVFLANVETSFKALDTNGDGMLEQAELAAAEAKGVQDRLAARRAQFEAEFAKLDANHDGKLNMAEFMAAAPKAPVAAPSGAEVAALFDRNHDGKVSLSEFRAARLSAFDKLDTNHDGTISDSERQSAGAHPR